MLWQQITSDLDTMEAWLAQAEAELAELRGKDLSADIHTIEQRIRKLKVCVTYLVYKNICAFYMFSKCSFLMLLVGCTIDHSF